MFSFGIVPEGSGPLRGGEPGSEVVWGEHGDGMRGLSGGSVHGEHKVAACKEVPGLQDGAVARLFQLPGNPLGPFCVRVRIADEEVFAVVLVQGSVPLRFIVECIREGC